MNRLSDATLNGMTKKRLIEYVRMCEHNYDIAEEMLRQQAENVEDWQPVRRGKWVETVVRGTPSTYCSMCGSESPVYYPLNFCPDCGAEMCGGDTDGDQV